MTPPPSYKLNFKVELDNQKFITLTPGAGGEGQPGQAGLFSGWRGMPVYQDYCDGGEDCTNNQCTGTDCENKECYIGGAGGVGGTGGGGGAGGLAEQSYGLVFICKKKCLN